MFVFLFLAKFVEKQVEKAKETHGEAVRVFLFRNLSLTSFIYIMLFFEKKCLFYRPKWLFKKIVEVRIFLILETSLELRQHPILKEK